MHDVRTASSDFSTRPMAAEESPLVANMAALWATDPALARRLEPYLDGQGYPVEPSRAGLPTAAVPAGGGRRLYLHSRYNPMEEAERLLDAAGAGQQAIFAVFGLGLGYHVQRLFERAGPETVVVVFEPDLRLIRTAFEQTDLAQHIRSGRLIFIVDADRGRLVGRLTGQQALFAVGFTMVTHPPSVQLHPQFHAQMRTWMEEFVAFARTNLNTAILNARRTCENIARNLGWYVSTPGIDRLKGRHAGQPAIIVSAGPSLRKNAHLLGQARGRAVLIAVQTTLQPLLDMGIEPQYVTSLDYHDICTRFFERLPRQLRCELVAEPKAAASVLRMYPGPISLVGNEFAERLVREMDLRKGAVRAGATVAHLAFYLAEYMGCDPVIFVGQDLGFSDGLCYVPGTGYEEVWRPELGRFCTMEMKQWEHIVRERPILRRITDWQGRPMYTEERLFAYLQQFERDFALTAARVIDATEGGAMKRGATPMTLAEALRDFCAAPLPEAPDDYPGRRDELVPACVECLRRRRQEARGIQEIARQTLPLLQEVRDNLEDQSRVNRLIARIDALRARMHRFDDCYELIKNLTQHSELARFRSDRQIMAARLSGIELQQRQVERDIANVGSIADAAVQFEQLMDEVIGELSAWKP